MEVWDENVWPVTNRDDLWVFDKLLLARYLGYECGPAGVQVPRPGEYVVRPIYNLFGMGLLARIEQIESTTYHLHPSEFWCEKFDGRHISVDYENGEQVVAFEGIRESGAPLYKFSRWTRIEEKFEYPHILKSGQHLLRGRYSRVNCEFVDGKLIEVHLRSGAADLPENSTNVEVLWDPKGEKEHPLMQEARVGFKEV